MFLLSLPMRGAWIEIFVKNSLLAQMSEESLPMRGAWIEMQGNRRRHQAPHRRSPCGERGLKLEGIKAAINGVMSLPMRGAWIEI